MSGLQDAEHVHRWVYTLHFSEENGATAGRRCAECFDHELVSMAEAMDVLAEAAARTEFDPQP